MRRRHRSSDCGVEGVVCSRPACGRGLADENCFRDAGDRSSAPPLRRSLIKSFPCRQASQHAIFSALFIYIPQPALPQWHCSRSRAAPTTSFAAMSDVEKKSSPRSSSYSVNEVAKPEDPSDDNVLVDPTHDTLQRGLKARQISMIAVCSMCLFSTPRPHQYA